MTAFKPKTSVSSPASGSSASSLRTPQGPITKVLHSDQAPPKSQGHVSWLANISLIQIKSLGPVNILNYLRKKLKYLVLSSSSFFKSLSGLIEEELAQATRKCSSFFFVMFYFNRSSKSSLCSNDWSLDPKATKFYYNKPLRMWTKL